MQSYGNSFKGKAHISTHHKLSKVLTGSSLSLQQFEKYYKILDTCWFDDD